MDAPAPPYRHAGPRFCESRVAVAAAVLAANASLHLLGFLIIGRRFGGAVDRPAPAALLLVAVAVMGVYSWLSRRVWRDAFSPRTGTEAHRGLDAVVGWGPSLAMILLTLGLSVPLERYIDWLVWTPLWVADVFWRASFFAGEPFVHQVADASAGASSKAVLDHLSNAAQSTDQLDEPMSDGVLLQQVSRLRDRDGVESIAGQLRAEFVAGQRTAEMYIGFCPPFGRTPTVEVDQTGGPPAHVKTGQCLPHGARIDVRLNAPAAAAECVEVDVFACG